MQTEKRLADLDHPLVQQAAQELTCEISDPSEQVRRIFEFVRDKIEFGFSPQGDFVRASQTIERGYGQCNTKGTLILALCKAAGIPTRLHLSRISKEIQHGFFTVPFYCLMPKEITHSWLEVEIDGRWRQVDTYINDLALHDAAVLKLKQNGWQTGFSVTRATGEPSAEFALDEAHYSQMVAVIGDHGTWDEPADSLNGQDYLNRPGVFKQWLYRMYLPLANHRVRKLRGDAPLPESTN